MKKLVKAFIILALTFSMTLVVEVIAPIVLVPPEPPKSVKSIDVIVGGAETVPDFTLTKGHGHECNKEQR